MLMAMLFASKAGRGGFMSLIMVSGGNQAKGKGRSFTNSDGLKYLEAR